MKTEDLAKEIANLVPKVMRNFRSRYLLTTGVSVSQIVILTNLESEGGISLKELAKKIGISSATASILIDKLVKAGLIERREDEKDRRKITLRLTNKGKTTVNQFRNDIVAMWKKILIKSFTPGEQVSYLKILKKIAQGLEDED